MSAFLIRFWSIICPFFRRQSVVWSFAVGEPMMLLLAKQRQQVCVSRAKERKNANHSHILFSLSLPSLTFEDWSISTLRLVSDSFSLVFIMQFEVSVALNFLIAYLYNKLPRRWVSRSVTSCSLWRSILSFQPSQYAWRTTARTFAY